MDVVAPIVSLPWLEAADVMAFVSSAPTSKVSLSWRGPSTMLKLEPESEISDMDESVHSGQMDLTASCHDTEDTETSSGDTEFSIASSQSTTVSLPEISSGPEDVFETFHPISSRQKICVKCRIRFSSPFLYCRRCFNDRKRFLPPRPILNNKKRRRMVTKADKSASSKESGPSKLAEEENFHNPSVEETYLKPSVCSGCMNAPCNGVFIHGDLGHQLFCYRCAQRIWLERKSCPYCNRTINKVVKLFKVEMD